MDNNNQDRVPGGINIPANLIEHERFVVDRAIEFVQNFVPPENREALDQPVAALANTGNRVINALIQDNNDLDLQVNIRDATIQALQGQINELQVDRQPHINVPIELVRVNPNIGRNRLQNVPFQELQVPAPILARGAHVREILENGLRPGVDLNRIVEPLNRGLIRQIINHMNGELNHVNGQFIGAIENLDDALQRNNALVQQLEGLDRLLGAQAEVLDNTTNNVRRQRNQIAELSRRIEDQQDANMQLRDANDRLMQHNQNLRADVLQLTEERELARRDVGENLVVVGLKRTTKGRTYTIDCEWGTNSIRLQRLTCQLEFGGNHTYVGYGPVARLIRRQGSSEIGIGFRGIVNSHGFRPFFVSHIGVGIPISETRQIRGHVMTDVVLPLDQIRNGKPVYQLVETHVTGSIDISSMKGSTVRVGRSVALSVPDSVLDSGSQQPARVRGVQSRAGKAQSFGTISLHQPSVLANQPKPCMGGDAIVGCLLVVSACWVLCKRYFRYVV